VPTFGVALSFKLMPNCSLFWVEAVWLANASMSSPPEVSVLPLTVIAYPEPALVDTPICDTPLPVDEVVSVPRLTLVPVAPEQLLFVMPDVPVQNVSVSSTVAETDIWLAVLAATVPLSRADEKALSEYVVMRAQKVVLVAVGLVTPVN
jgi:hypothetical protein